MPLNKYADQDEDRVCKGCPLVLTKPEKAPAELVEYVAMAAGLAEIKEIGGQFEYPDALTVVEWETLRCLKHGRDRAEKLKQDRDKKKRPKHGN